MRIYNIPNSAQHAIQIPFPGEDGFFRQILAPLERLTSIGSAKQRPLHIWDPLPRSIDSLLNILKDVDARTYREAN